MAGAGGPRRRLGTAVGRRTRAGRVPRRGPAHRRQLRAVLHDLPPPGRRRGDRSASSRRIPILERLIDHADVIAVGPGLGQSGDIRGLVRWLIQSAAKPLVIDADGLNALAGQTDCSPRWTGRSILTPHPGEFARLVGTSIAMFRPIEKARRPRLASRSESLVVVLKGAGTVVTDGRRSSSIRTGNPGMATGGAGDVLTGVIAALVGQKLPAFEAAQLGVYVHGLAGDIARDQNGEIGMIAGDIVDALPDAFYHASPGARHRTLSTRAGSSRSGRIAKSAVGRAISEPVIPVYIRTSSEACQGDRTSFRGGAPVGAPLPPIRTVAGGRSVISREPVVACLDLSHGSLPDRARARRRVPNANDPVVLLHHDGQPPEPDARLLRQMLEVQRQQLDLSREMVQVNREQRARQGAELERWQAGHEDVLDACRETLGRLEQVHASLMGELASYVEDNHENLLEGDFSLSDFVDRFGPRLAHLNTMLAVLRPLAVARPKRAES